jgi:hypothetical protein
MLTAFPPMSQTTADAYVEALRRRSIERACDLYASDGLMAWTAFENVYAGPHWGCVPGDQAAMVSDMADSMSDGDVLSTYAWEQPDFAQYEAICVLLRPTTIRMRRLPRDRVLIPMPAAAFKWLGGAASASSMRRAMIAVERNLRETAANELGVFEARAEVEHRDACDSKEYAPLFDERRSFCGRSLAPTQKPTRKRARSTAAAVARKRQSASASCVAAEKVTMKAQDC